MTMVPVLLVLGLRSVGGGPQGLLLVVIVIGRSLVRVRRHFRMSRQCCLIHQDASSSRRRRRERDLHRSKDDDDDDNSLL